MKTASQDMDTDASTHGMGDRKIFCVGFNKSGTTSLHRIFADQLGLRSAHNPRWTDWSISRETEMLARHQVYSDGGCPSIRNLDELYPDALFILNTRPLKKWVLSRHKGLARSRAAVRWALTRYVPLGWLAWLLERTVLADSPRAMARWIAIRNSYHRHVLDYFQGRDDKLLLLNIEDDTAYEQLTRFLDSGVTVTPPVANADGDGSTTLMVLDAIGSKVGKTDSSRAVDDFFTAQSLEEHAHCLTWFDSQEYRLNRSGSDLITAVLPFLRGPFRWIYRKAVGRRAFAKSFFAKWVWDRFIGFCRSEQDLHHFTTVVRMASASR